MARRMLQLLHRCRTRRRSQSTFALLNLNFQTDFIINRFQFFFDSRDCLLSNNVQLYLS